MFPFQYNNSFLQLNLDLNSSQPSGFPSQYLPKPELPTRIPSVYVQDTQPVYNNIPSLLNKRSAPVDLASASTKFINQEGFPFPVEVARAQDMAKNLQMHGKQDDLAPQKMIYRGAPDMYGVPKGSALGAQQIPRLNNGLQYPGLEMPQMDAQGYLGESASQAYIRQYLESKSMGGQDLGALMGSQNNDMQKYLASFYGLPNGAQNNLALQNLASLGNLGGLGNLGNLANMGGYGNLGSMNNPLMMELLNQARNQQLIQQLQEQAKNEQMRNLSLEMMLLNSGMGQNGLMNPLQQANMGQAGISQSLSPPSLGQNKSTTQTLILQRPDPVRQQDGLTRKDSTHSNNKVPIVQQQQPPAAKEVKEDPKLKNVVLANTESKGRQERLPVREEKPAYREERPQPQQQVKMNESRGKKVEQNNMVLQAPIVQEPEPSRDFNGDRGDRRKGRVNLQVEQQQTVVKKPVVQLSQRSQRRMQEFEEPMEEVLPVSRGRKSELAVQEKMTEEKKMAGRSSQNRMLAKEMNYIEAQKTQCTESEYSDKGTFGPASEEMRGHSLMRQFSLENANNGNLAENLYKTPEERLEEDKAVQKIVLTKVGRQYQTAIPEMVLNDDDEEEEVQQRECKLVWDPQVVNPRDIGNYMKNLQRLLGAKTINQEKALKLLCKKDFDLDETLSVVKKNERYYSNFFGTSSCTRELRSRRNIE